MHSAQDWAQYRSEKLSNAGLRRFSPKFIEQERVKFHQLRAKIRMLQKTNGAVSSLFFSLFFSFLDNK